MEDLKIVVWDMGWAGGLIAISSDPDSLIENWRKDRYEHNLDGYNKHVAKWKDGRDNPWIRRMNETKDIESFLSSNSIQIYDVEEGLVVETEGDS